MGGPPSLEVGKRKFGGTDMSTIYHLRQKNRPYLITHRVFTRLFKSWYRLLATPFPYIKDMDDAVKGAQLAIFE
jgi:hypothetical protein